MKTLQVGEEQLLKIKILPQPNDVTCGPTCLHALYNYYNDPISLQSVISEVQQFQDGGTLGVLLGIHALKRGYSVKIYSYNLHMFDPSWFGQSNDFIHSKLLEQWKYKTHKKFRFASKAYMQFLELGGELAFEELNQDLILHYMEAQKPLLTGLSCTYLYQSKREIGETNTYDDVKGHPAGHFVVINGIQMGSRKVYIADPLEGNPMSDVQHYLVDTQRLVNSILLGIVTYDANLLVIEPKN